MKKKIIVLGLTICILLTGCGVPDHVQEEIDKVDMGFISDHESINKLERKISNSLTEDAKTLTPYVFPEEKKQQISNLYQVVINRFEQNDLLNYYENSFWGPEDYYSEDKVSKEALDKFLSCEEFSRDAQYNLGFDMSGTEDFKNFLAELEKIGYANLLQCMPNYEGNSYIIISNGVKFDIYRDWEKPVYTIDITISVNHLEALSQLGTEVQETMGESFWLSSINEGGYIESYVYTGSFDEPGNPYRKSIYFFIKDEKLLQMEIALDGFTTNRSQLYFSEREQKAVTAILTALTGDEKAASTFATTIHAESGKKGSIGKYSWYRIKENNGDGYHSCTLRILEE